MTHPSIYARTQPNKIAYQMAGTGKAITYRELDELSNQGAHLFRALGLKEGDHIAFLIENRLAFMEICWAAQRSGLYYTAISRYLTQDEIAYIVKDCGARVVITSPKCAEQIRGLATDQPGAPLFYMIDEPLPGFRSWDREAIVQPTTPIADEVAGYDMLYSSGTTGRPKGILRPLPEQPPSQQLPLYAFLDKLWQYRDGMIYLSPAPLYHSAPQAAVSLTIDRGGTAIIMETFDAERYLELVQQYQVTHSQLVPTMFSRMLKLPDAARRRYDLSSLQCVVHAAAPCPVPVKQQMIEWWGPIILEYYGMTEAMGFSACDSAEWLKHPGTVGKVLFGELHVLDDALKPCPTGTPGTLWFKTAKPFEYFNAPEATAKAQSADGSMSTVGDVGYVDDDGYLYLTDRATFIIISGGVNIYPQECENLLITHPKVADAAVFGVPNQDLGEEVKAAVQLMPGNRPGPDLAGELMAFCAEHLAHIKCPRSIDFEAELPRLPTGKLYKRLLRERYWAGHKTRIV